jgi:hypothetical protein
MRCHRLEMAFSLEPTIDKAHEGILQQAHSHLDQL